MPFTNPFRRPKKDKPTTPHLSSSHDTENFSSANPLPLNGNVGKLSPDVLKPQLLFHAQVVE